ncbi:MAG: sigma-70 family RNA polymerase sigma factor [Phycisphaerae bacterium]
MLRFQQGDRAAFDELVRRNTPRIHALIYRFLGDPGMVEDLTQEVFLRVFRTAERYRPTAKFSTWLYRIAANLSFNVLRSRKKGVPVSLETLSGSAEQEHPRQAPDPGAPAPHDNMDSIELRRQVARAIADLPDNQRIAIVLNKYEDKSYDEIAEVMDCSTMAVKSLLSRARGNLRRQLRRYLKP